mgnify:CR=1 FL=1
MTKAERLVTHGMTPMMKVGRVACPCGNEVKFAYRVPDDIWNHAIEAAARLLEGGASADCIRDLKSEYCPICHGTDGEHKLACTSTLVCPESFRKAWGSG